MNSQDFTIMFQSIDQFIDEDLEIFYDNNFSNMRTFFDMYPERETESEDQSTYSEKIIINKKEETQTNEKLFLGKGSKRQRNDKNIFKVFKGDDDDELMVSSANTTNFELKCRFCDKIFKRKLHFEKHIKSHENPKNYLERVFKCVEINCGKVYKSKENLVLHIKNIHMNIKPYKCKFCNNSFSHRNGKLYHERRFHENNSNSTDRTSDKINENEDSHSNVYSVNNLN
jgi:hypothetical protein